MHDRAVWVAGALAGLALLVANVAVIQPWTLDDAYITFRYADHLAAGWGPVYNIGERVEGYTCFLWVVLLAAGSAAGLATEAWAKGLGLTLAASAVIGTGVVGARWLGPTAGGLAALLVGASTVASLWAMSGMEVPLVAACVLATAALVEEPGVRARAAGGVAGALAVMARPDAALVVGVLLLAATARRERRAGVAAIAAAAVYVPYFAWRWTWYGWLLPNTFYAKVGATDAQVARGLGYVTDFVVATPGLWMPAAIGTVAALWVRDRRSVVLAAGLAVHTGYVVAVGGDVMPAYRFFAPLVPLFALLGVRGLSALGRPGFLLAVIAVGAMQVQGYTRADLFDRVANGNVGRNGVEVGRWLAANVPPGTLLATNSAGGVPYASGLPTIDMLGLNDATIAHTPAPAMGRGKAGHERANGAYVLDREPDLVMLGAARGSRRPVFRSDRQLVRDPRFRRDYTPRVVKLPSGASLTLFVRKDRDDLSEALR